jgi:hypothetical protein
MRAMNPWNHDGSSYEQIVDKHGPWSAMSIWLGDGTYTREPAVDRRLKRLVQIVADHLRKPLHQCRVLDLACLEGHYGIEFALHGAQVVCVEIRAANLAKTAYAVAKLGLSNCQVLQDDVRNLNRAQYGEFDVIICSGILYHLQAKDAAKLIHSMSECCSHLCVVDTYVAARETSFVEIGDKRFGGILYREHVEGASSVDKVKDLWASIDNDASFWFTVNALATIYAQAGFTSCTEVLLPTQPELTYDRRMFVAVKGAPVRVLSSELTDRSAHVGTGVPDPSNLHPCQLHHGLAFRVGKQLLPQQVKNAIKPTLRKLGVLKTKESSFNSEKR